MNMLELPMPTTRELHFVMHRTAQPSASPTVGVGNAEVLVEPTVAQPANAASSMTTINDFTYFVLISVSLQIFKMRAGFDATHQLI
jgi:hypothetical protein